MSAEIIRLAIRTKVPHKPDDILEAAKGQGFDDVLVIGLQPAGKPLWVSSSTSDIERVVFMVNWAMREIMDVVVQEQGQEGSAE